MTHAAEPYPKKICDHWSACMHFNWRYKNSQLTKAQMELSPLQFPKERTHGDSDESARVTPTKVIEKPPESHYLTHFPKHLGCESCFKTKTLKKPHRRKGENPKVMPLPKPMKFGDIITADHLSFGKRDQSQRGDRFAYGVLDRYSGWIDCFPVQTKDAESVKAAMQEFLRSDDKVENFWTDNAPELAQAARELGYRHHRSADNRPQSNGVAERAMRRILEGTRSTLHRSGMDHAY